MTGPLIVEDVVLLLLHDGIGPPATATTLLHGAVATTTGPEGPSGCLVVQGALAVAPAGASVRDLLADRRDDVRSRLEERFRRARDEGGLPGSDALHRVADGALRAWPPAGPVRLRSRWTLP